MQKGINRGHVVGKGFTLIELLVVIAIIGILAGIVLASLGSARNKGGDAAVQGDIDSIRSQAELYASNHNNSYGTMGTTSNSGCNSGIFSDPTIQSAISGAVNAGGGTVECGAWSTGSGGWVVAAKLKSSSNYWCVSSSGSSTMLVTSGAIGLTSTVGDSCY